MAAQQGFKYEINATNILKPMGYVPMHFRPAGAGHNQPDLMLLFKNKEAGCELKITAASAGSLILKYNTKTKSWGFNDISESEDEKIFIKALAHEINLFNRIKKEWTEIPYKRDRDLQWDMTAGKLTNMQRYERDRDTFKDIKGEIPANKIEQYYNKKDTYYVNIGTHGFYLMGTKNPLGLKNVPTFGASAKAQYRARVQYKGSGQYQFTFEMNFSMKNKSKYNIAPVDGKSVDIIVNKMDLSCFV